MTTFHIDGDNTYYVFDIIVENSWFKNSLKTEQNKTKKENPQKDKKE